MNNNAPSKGLDIPDRCRRIEISPIPSTEAYSHDFLNGIGAILEGSVSSMSIRDTEDDNKLIIIRKSSTPLPEGAKKMLQKLYETRSELEILFSD